MHRKRKQNICFVFLFVPGNGTKGNENEIQERDFSTLQFLGNRNLQSTGFQFHFFPGWKIFCAA